MSNFAGDIENTAPKAGVFGAFLKLPGNGDTADVLLQGASFAYTKDSQWGKKKMCAMACVHLNAPASERNPDGGFTPTIIDRGPEFWEAFKLFLVRHEGMGVDFNKTFITIVRNGAPSDKKTKYSFEVGRELDQEALTRIAGMDMPNIEGLGDMEAAGSGDDTEPTPEEADEQDQASRAGDSAY